jgi:hypothetical protein
VVDDRHGYHFAWAPPHLFCLFRLWSFKVGLWTAVTSWLSLEEGRRPTGRTVYVGFLSDM